MVSTNQPWQAEWEVSPALAQQLIETQFPELAPVEIDVLGEGWDNLALLINDSLVFRFPRRALGAEVMVSELTVLPHLVDRLDTPIPRLTHIGRETESYPCRFAGYGRLPGVTACSADPNEQQRRRLAAPLADFLRQLHAIDEHQARQWDALPDNLRRTDVGRRSEQGRAHLDRAVELNLLPATRRELLAEFLVDLELTPPTPADGSQRPRCLVHGDLYVRHLLVDDEGQLLGVIDWGDVHYGDPAIDLAVAFCYLPPEGLQDFIAAYGVIDESMGRLAMMRAIQHTALLSTYAHDVEDKWLLSSALGSLIRLESYLKEDNWR